MRSENNKIVEEGIKKIEEGNVVKKDSLLSLTSLIDFFQMLCIWLFFVLNGISRLLLLLPIISREFNQLILLRDGPLEKWLEGGGGAVFSFHEFVFSLTACAGIFFVFRWTPLHEFFFFQTNIAFFEQWNLDSLSMFLCFINYSTLTTDQRIQATLMQNLFENVHTVREEEATWSGRLPCAFFQSLPSGIPLPQPIIMMPYSIHQNSPSVGNKRWQAKHDS